MVLCLPPTLKCLSRPPHVTSNHGARMYTQVNSHKDQNDEVSSTHAGMMWDDDQWGHAMLCRRGLHEPEEPQWRGEIHLLISMPVVHEMVTHKIQPRLGAVVDNCGHDFLR